MRRGEEWEGVAGFKWGCGQRVQIEPIVLLPALGLEAEVQVEAVHIGNDAGHVSHLHEAGARSRLTGAATGDIIRSTNPAEESIFGPTPRKGRFPFWPRKGRGNESRRGVRSPPPPPPGGGFFLVAPARAGTFGPTPPMRRRFFWHAKRPITAMPPAQRPWPATGPDRGSCWFPPSPAPA